MKVIIIGAGGHARVVYEVLRYDKNVEVVAFVDNKVIRHFRSHAVGDSAFHP